MGNIKSKYDNNNVVHMREAYRARPSLQQNTAPIPNAAPLPNAAPIPNTASLPNTAPIPNIAPIPNAAPLPNAAPIPNIASLPNAIHYANKPHIAKAKGPKKYEIIKRPKWEFMNTFPFKRFSKGIGMNQNEFIIVSNSLNNTGKDGVYIYNIYKNTCNQTVNYKHLDLGNVDNPNAALNKRHNTLYIHCGIYDNHKLIKINLNTLKTNVVRNEYQIGYDAQCITINNVFHIIGGWTNNKHYIFDEQTNSFTEIYTFDEFHPGFGNFSLVHLASEHKLLLFGGKHPHFISDTVYSFCTVQYKWNKLNVKLPVALYGSAAVKYNYDQYVMLFGGITGSSHVNIKTIYIFDVKANKFYESKNVFCPFKGTVKAIKTSNYIHRLMLISGYIRCVIIVEWPGQDMIDLIVAMYGLDEYAHLIGDGYAEGGIHKRINLHEFYDYLKNCHDLPKFKTVTVTSVGKQSDD
eukprot:123360_1